MSADRTILNQQTWKNLDLFLDTAEGFSIVVICFECKDGHDAGNCSGTRMVAISGRFAGPHGFVFQCPRCERTVTIAYVEERLAAEVEIVPVKKRRKAQMVKEYRRVSDFTA